MPAKPVRQVTAEMVLETPPDVDCEHLCVVRTSYQPSSDGSVLRLSIHTNQLNILAHDAHDVQTGFVLGVNLFKVSHSGL